MGWQAKLTLDYSVEDQRCVARHVHEGPLRVLKALYPEGDRVCHHVLVHPPSGLVSGDNLAATFSPELSDLTIYVIDVAAGEKIPRKGGPGITKSDLFIINKTDLAPHVGANLEVMKSDTERMRTGPQGLKPFVMTNLKTLSGLDTVVAFIETKGMLATA